MKRLMLSIVTLIVTYSATSQTHLPTSNDTVIKLSITVAKDIIKRIKQSRIKDSLLQANGELIVMLKTHISSQDSMLNIHVQKGFQYERLIYNYNQTIDNYKLQADQFTLQIKQLNASVKQERRRTLVSRIVGAVITAALVIAIAK